LFARQVRPKVAFVSHKLGGGAQQHVNELAALYASDALFLQITPDEDGATVTLSVFDQGQRLQDGLYFDVEREYDKLVSLLRELGVGHVHFHHTMGLHPRLWVLAAALGCKHDLTIHDYYLVNGNPTLTDKDARFVADDAVDFDQRCAQHYPLPEGVSGDDWRRNQKLLVEGADRVIFPSRDCALRFGRYFDMAQPCVAFHPDYQTSQPYPEARWKFDCGRPLRVLVIGAISREKGADLLEQVADSLADENIEFHLLGYAYRGLNATTITHGPYDNDRVYELVAAIDPDIVWFPALWPETYSYTLSIALHMGLPVVVPDIGAFGERVLARPYSLVQSWDSTVPEWRTLWQKLANGEAMPGAGEGEAAPSAQDASFYAGSYLAAVPARGGELLNETLSSLSQNLHAGVPQLTNRERVLNRIWRLSRRPLVAKMISIVPFRMQQAVKRRLSSRPMHDIVR
jgi:glycosyltransferase involved in cell wall biosynthesis